MSTARQPEALSKEQKQTLDKYNQQLIELHKIDMKLSGKFKGHIKSLLKFGNEYNKLSSINHENSKLTDQIAEQFELVSTSIGAFRNAIEQNDKINSDKLFNQLRKESVALEKLINRYVETSFPNIVTYKKKLATLDKQMKKLPYANTLIASQYRKYCEDFYNDIFKDSDVMFEGIINTDNECRQTSTDGMEKIKICLKEVVAEYREKFPEPAEPAQQTHLHSKNKTYTPGLHQPAASKTNLTYKPEHKSSCVIV